MAVQEKTDLLVAGVGNEFRSDDGVGLVALRRFRDRCRDAAATVEIHDDVTRLLDQLPGFTSLYLIDAVRSGAPPGTVHQVDLSTGATALAALPSSTHGVSIATLLGLAKEQGDLPRKVVLFGIEGAAFGYGNTLTPAVEEAVDHLVEKLRWEVERDNV